MKHFNLKNLGMAAAAILLGAPLSAADTPANQLPEWAFGGFQRTQSALIEPVATSTFLCPVKNESVAWEKADTFNPAAVVKDGKVYILYRAEDNPDAGIGGRVSRIGMAISEDGTTIAERKTEPVFYPDQSALSQTYEVGSNMGGCEDPRVVAAKDASGNIFYVMTYTSWNHDKPRLSIATSTDLMTWERKGPAFLTAFDGKYKDLSCKSGSIVTKVDADGNQYAAKVKIGSEEKYLMYWGETAVYAATSDDLFTWTPYVDTNKNNELIKLAQPRDFYFDSSLTECGPPAIITDKGILLFYNGKNKGDLKGDTDYAGNTYAAGQMLFSLDNPYEVKARLDKPFFRPMADFEKSGQYADGTVFIEGLVFFNGKWYLYYGCADSKVAVAVYDPANRTAVGDPLTVEETSTLDPDIINAFPKNGWGKVKTMIHSCSGQTKPEEGAFYLNTRHTHPDKKWCENQSDKPWVIFEFDNYYDIYRFAFADAKTREPGSQNQNHYWLYVSTADEVTADSDSWELLLDHDFKGEGNNVNVKDDTFPAKKARYLKAVFEKRDGAVRIYGCDIYGKYNSPIERNTQNIAYWKTILKSYDHANERETAQNLLNGRNDPSNKWCFFEGAEGDPIKYAVIDLEDTYDLSEIKIIDCVGGGENNPNIQKLSIYGSTELPVLSYITPQGDSNTCWTKLVDETDGGNDGVKSYKFGTPATNSRSSYTEGSTATPTVRYLKIEVPFKTGANNFTCRVCGLEVYGTPNSGTTGVSEVSVENEIPAKYYDVTGREIANPAKGQLMIRVQGTKVSKVVL